MIRILDRYIARDFLKLFCLTLMVLLAISIIVHLFERLHRYVAWGASAADVMNYYFYAVPRETLRIAPVALLISSFLSVGRLSRNFEFLAMQMARLHPLRVVLPVILLALAITGSLHLVQEEVAPKASEIAFQILQQRVRKSSKFYRTRRQDIWYLAGPDRILHIDFLQTAKGEMRGVSFFHFSPDLVLLTRTEAAWVVGKMGAGSSQGYGSTASWREELTSASPRSLKCPSSCKRLRRTWRGSRKGWRK